MTKKQLIDQVARKAHLTKRGAEESVETFLSEIVRVVSKGENVVLSGFGTFRRRPRDSKTVKIPKKDEFVTIKKHWAPTFTAGKKFRRVVSK